MGLFSKKENNEFKEYIITSRYFIIDDDNSLKEELEGQKKDSENLIKFRYIYDIKEIADEE